MRVLAINGSPRGAAGNTERMLAPLLAGICETGASAETVYLNQKRIGHCQGCFSCWTRTPGRCVQEDDMGELLEKIARSDLLVYATPLYYFTVTGLMKDFLDRQLPLLTPAIAEENGRYTHHSRTERGGHPKIVLLSNCGFPGRYNFDGLVETFSVMTGGRLTATILCTQGGLLASGRVEGILRPYFEALRRGGRELAGTGAILPETQAILDADLMDPELYRQQVNNHWKTEGA